MGLTVAQSNDLVDALLDAFPDKPRLEFMVKRRLERRLNQITQDNLDYELTVDKLVEWSESNGCLLALVAGASCQNPKNVKLCNFVKRHLQSLLEEGSRLLASEMLASLIQALQPIGNFIEVVLPVFSQTLPDADLISNYRENLSNADLSAAAKWLMILDLLLRYEQNSQGQLPVVSFVQNLERKVKSGSARSALSGWLSELPKELRPAQKISKPAGQERPSDEALKQLHGYFAIAVEPPGITVQTDLYTVKGYLISRLNDRNLGWQVRSIPLQVPDAGSSAQSSQLSEERQGLLCTLSQIEHSLPEWLLQAEEAIDYQREALKTRYNLPSPPIYRLTIEFWLPFEHLIEAVDTWKIYSKPVRFKRRRRLIGKAYRVAVCSYDRFDDKGSWNELDRTWQRLCAFGQTLPDPVSIEETLEHIACWQDCESIYQRLNNIDRRQQERFCLGLTLSCPLCLEQYQDQWDALFGTILDTGIPLTLWSRRADLDNLEQTMQDLLSADTLPRLDRLFDQVKQTRYQANNDSHLGAHLAIWCDDPNQFRAIKQFQTAGRLGQ